LLRPALAALLAALLAAAAPAHAAAPAVAFHYGAQPPLTDLRVYDWVVLEPGQLAPGTPLPEGPCWFAYVSIGQILPSRDYAAELPAQWLRGRDAHWGGLIVDQAAPGWRAFFLERILAPLWAQGWRGFFLDTVDAYAAFAPAGAPREAQEAALAGTLDAIRVRFPGVRLITNRGFELLGRLRQAPDAIAAESLFDRWDPARRAYASVPAADRDWLRERLAQAQARYGIPAIVIDYRPLAQRAQARETARRIRAEGFTPWVAPAGLAALGVGALELQPRRIALVVDRAPQSDIAVSEAMRYLNLPLDYLGYVVEPFDLRAPLPEHLLDGRYAAVVTWFTSAAAAQNPRFEDWLGRQIDGGLKWVTFNEVGIEPEGALARRLGLTLAPPPAIPVSIEGAAAAGYETAPPRFEAMPVALRAAPEAQVALRVRGADGRVADAVALLPWGGYALAPYALAQRGTEQDPHWVIDPIDFLRRALDALPAPVADLTSEGGRRILFAQVDGDGFSSRAELPGSPYAGQVLAERVLRRYPIPTTLSVIEAELTDLRPGQQDAPALRELARRDFALPNVEIASHSYSHPFRWQALEHADRGAAAEAAWSLPVPGYEFDLAREIAGSADFIDRELAPPGKRTRLFLWTGDCLPDARAVAAVHARGLLNLNGGDTLATGAQASLAGVSGAGVLRDGQLQVYAPEQNENVYTNLWTGPYYGYQRAIETFAWTGAPRRLKPIDIYYHFYSATKPAALAALTRVYDWALAQPTTALYASDYVAKVQDYAGLAIARDWRDAAPHWRIASDGALRSLRLDGALPPPDLVRSQALAGSQAGVDGRYLILAAPRSELVLDAGAPATAQLTEASGWISDWQRVAEGTGARTRFTFSSYWAPQFTLADAAGCRVQVDGRALAPQGGAGTAPARYVLPAPASATLEAQRHDVQVRCP
jgi:hypothetical protein